MSKSAIRPEAPKEKLRQRPLQPARKPVGVIAQVISAAKDAESGNVGPNLGTLTREQRRRILFGK